VVAVDTNLLVYAHRTDAAFHDAARNLIQSIAQGAAAWAIPGRGDRALVGRPRFLALPAASYPQSAGRLTGALPCGGR